MASKRVKVAALSDIKTALRKGRVEADDLPVATAIQYSRKFDIYVLSLSNGTRSGLQDASAAQLKHVELLGRGTGLHWPDLDVDLYVPALVAGIHGSKEWMQEVGRRGGAVRSDAKAAAARKNGAKGGRPVKSGPQRDDERCLLPREV